MRSEGARRGWIALRVAGVAALAIAPRQPFAADGGCDLAVSAAPARLEAGAPRPVRVRVAAALPVPPAIAASVGRIEGVRAAEGGWVADWIAPEASVPRVAIVAALAEGGARCGFVAVPLDGRGDAVVRTRARARVSVRIAERTFGPATADDAGVAVVPVEVPPGVTEALDGSRRIPLDLPPVPNTALFLAPAARPAHQPSEVRGLLVAVTPEGAPARGPAPALVPSAGEAAAGEPAGPGAWRIAWRLPPGAAEATLASSRPGEPPFRATLRRPPGPAAALRVSLDRDTVRPGEGPVVATVAIDDGVGNPADAAVAAASDAGSVGPVERSGPGTYRVRWTLPGHHGGRRRAALSVTAGGVAARAEVGLAAGPPARLALVPARSWVVADGRAALPLVAEVADAEGNPADVSPTAFAAGAGAVEPPRAAGAGRFALEYRPRPSSAFGADEVVAELPPLGTRARVALHPPTFPAALGASAGVAVGPGGWLGLQAGAEASAWRWVAAQELGVAAAATFTRLREDQDVRLAGAAAPFTGEVRTTALLLSLGWRRCAARRVTLRAAAGGGVARVESLVSAGGASLSEAAWVGAATGAGAVGLRAGPGELFAQARWTWLPDPELATLSGAPSTFSFSVGYQLHVR